MRKSVFNNKNGGFSLVEIITVLCITAVFMAVLVPTLLHYVERMRAQRDDSAMHEVVHVIEMSLMDQDIYDELLWHSAINNYASYVDSDHKDITKEDPLSRVLRLNENGELVEWTFYDEARLKDEEPYFYSGNMRGLTITFIPSIMQNGEIVFKMEEALINDGLYKADLTADGGRITGYDTTKTQSKLGAMRPESANTRVLCDHLISMFGPYIVPTSQTYMASEFTVFLRIGQMNALNDNSNKDTMKIYGQWNGTTLTAARLAN